MPCLLDAHEPYSRRFRRLPSGCAPAFQPSCRHLVQASNALRRFGLIRSALRRGDAALRSPAVSALSGQCLDRAGRRPTTTMASSDFCRPFGPPYNVPSHWQDDRPLRVRRATFLPSTRRIYATPVRMTLGFRSMRPLAHRRDASCDSCTSGQEFAFRFLRIPPRGRHPCGSARSSCHEGLQRDLHPPSRIPAHFRSPVRNVSHDAARHA